MIPAIKESNQLKSFLGFKEHYPEFYKECMDQIGGMAIRNKLSDDIDKNIEGKAMQFTSLKEFTIAKGPNTTAGPDSGNQQELQASHNPKQDLLKFITGG